MIQHKRSRKHFELNVFPECVVLPVVVNVERPKNALFNINNSLVTYTLGIHKTKTRINVERYLRSSNVFLHQVTFNF